MKKRYWFLLFILLGVGAGFYVSQPPTVSDHYIISGGPILTMDSAEPRVEAVAVENGLIAGRGNLAALKEKFPDAAAIDLNGDTLMPGLIEPHTHPIASALLGAVVDVSGFTYSNRKSIMDALKEAANATAITPWLIAYGWDPVAVTDLDAPTLAELDAIAPDRPAIILTQMMHEAYVNTAALEAAGIPTEGEPEFRHGVLRDAEGHPTGTLREIGAINRVMDSVPPADDPVVEILLRKQFAAYAKAGYTTIGVTGAVGRHPDPVGLLQRVSEDAAPLRCIVYLMQNQLDRMPLGGDDNFVIAGAKFWMDGSPFAGGAATDEPYEDTHLTNDRLGIPHGHLADLAMNESVFTSEVIRLHKLGYQIAVHVQGEHAIETALAAFEDAQKASPNPELHHRLEHNALITDKQIAKAKALGVSLGFFVDHVYFYGDALVDLFGKERAARYMPMRRAFDAGVVTTLHGDHPATPIGPLRSVRTAILRQSRSGKTITAADQAITVNQALLAVTRNAARQLGRDDRIGSLEIGKLADFAELAKDPTLVPPQDIPGIQVVRTWKSGQPVDTRVVSWLKPRLVVSALWNYIRSLV